MNRQEEQVAFEILRLEHATLPKSLDSSDLTIDLKAMEHDPRFRRDLHVDAVRRKQAVAVDVIDLNDDLPGSADTQYLIREMSLNAVSTTALRTITPLDEGDLVWRSTS